MNLASDRHDVRVITNAARVAERAKHMTSETKLQEAIEEGAQEQWQHDARRTVGALAITMPEHPIFWASSWTRERFTRREP